MKRVAVIILNWNGKTLLEKFLPSVVAYTPDWAEIIIADNGSSDDSIAWLTDKYPSINIIRFDQNLGFAEGYNQAINQIEHEYCVLLNSDVEVTPDWLDILISPLDSDPTIVCAQPKIRSWRNKAFFEYAGAAGGYMDRYGYPFCRGRVCNIVEKDKGQYDMPTDILWATGACLLIRTSIYKGIGGFDKDFFAHQEEIDMCWRIRAKGYRLLCVPKSLVYHVGGATLNTESPRKTFLNFRNNLLMLYKNLPEEELQHVMRIRFWLDYIAAFKFLLEGHFQNAKAIYKARKAYHRLKPSYLAKREINQRNAILKPIPELMNKSLVLAFYLKGKKTFTSLLPFFR